jgi:hypothetical protein
MRKLFAGAILLSLAVLPASARPQRDKDDRRDKDARHDQDKNKGQAKREDRNRGRDDQRDQGKRKVEEKREVRGDEHRNWDYNRDRSHPGRPFPHGRYEHVRERFVIRTFDVRTRRVFFPDRSVWVIAAYDIPRCRDWYWDRDVVYVYDDDAHPGWYVLFNVRLGHYVHVEYFGVG